ncbi:hypothetical protein ACFX1X_002406 [Malus domestica]
MCAEIAVCSFGLAAFVRLGGIFFFLCGGRAEGETKSRSRGRRRCRRRWVRSELWDQQTPLKSSSNSTRKSPIPSSEPALKMASPPNTSPEWSGEVRSVTYSADAKSVFGCLSRHALWN